MTDKEFIKHIVFNGTIEEKKELYGFDENTPLDIVIKKFKIFAKANFIRYFTQEDAPFHKQMIEHSFRSYRGENAIDLGFRGDAKTTLRKLIRVYILLNDKSRHRKYLKVLSRDLQNSRQIVTDIYNMLLELTPIYGDVFEREGDKKREETMSSFTLKSGVKLTAGTVGQKQRGHIQDAYRPDWLWFEDIEDRESISSQAITENVIRLCDEAITGLSFNGSWELTGNYIFDAGTVQWFLNKKNTIKIITPILTNYTLKGSKIDSGTPTWGIYTLDKIKELEGSVDDFWGDFMCEPNRSKNKFFDIEKIERDIKLSRPPIRESVGVKYWGVYQPHHRYGQGSDHSEGIGEDANTLAGFDFTTGELVYTYANNEISPDLSAHQFAKVGSEFGNCIWAPEVNNKCGGIVLATAVDTIQYPNLFKQETNDEGYNKQKKKVGWDTNNKTKNTMFFDFRRDYNDNLIKIYDIEVLKEMKAYTNNDLKENTTGLITRHFDLLTAVVIAWQMNRKAEKSSVSVGYHDV